ncbi:uncharacterized protein SAPINGB_P003935 [Magnusiomyces paraingens]|uniref:Cell wall protein CWP1 n=1 Tax=Magnusiomyces paraingens TaxID=2606893 RepID=A0A5E8BXC2_9ASCO|nr:uncharacterized protein SAPINGB_P003935 [Saprochaete ingens]VVT54157.1 unnamed protein product [Saprochaete ingens]
MQFFIALSVFAAAAQAAIQGNTAFGLIVIRSGSPVQYSSLKEDSNRKLVIDSSISTDFTGFFLPDGRVRVGGTDSWLAVGSDEQLAVLTATPQNFGVDDNNWLTLSDGTSNFYLLSSGDSTYNVYNGAGYSQSNAIGIALRVVWDETNSTSSESVASSTVASSIASSSHSAVASSSSTASHASSIASSQVTSAPTAASSPISQVVETVTICHKNGTCTHASSSVAQVNGAVNVGSYFGAAVAAVAAAAGALFL